MKNRLKDIREDNDLKQEKIAEILQISRQYYSRYELGQVELPIRHYIKLAEFYNVSIDYLTGLVSNPKPIKETNTISLTLKQKRLLEAYDKNPRLQEAIDKLLNL